MSFTSTQGTRVVMPAPHVITIETYDVPAPAPGQALIECEASAISAGTELAVYTGVHQWLNDPTRAWPKWPFTPGYSGVGRIIAVGDGVKRFKVGDRVVWPSRHETHAVVDVEQPDALIFPIAERVPAQVAAFAVLARFPLSALVQSDQIIGRCVAVMGLGTIGQIALRLYAAAGAYPLIGIDGVGGRRALAEQVQGVVTFAPEDPQLKDKLRASNFGQLPDIVVDATGFPNAVKTAMNIVTDGGRVVMVGSPRGIASEVDFYWDLHGRSITLIGAHGSAIGWEPRERFSYTVPRAMRLLIALLEDGRLKLDEILSHFAHAREAKAMYDGLLNDKERYHAVALHW
ncbi:MAG: oxidoreductase [Candidatus Roseilinea sp.]|nr:MAG: oxidoreductase [Candidatus Roseilinea sp.]